MILDTIGEFINGQLSGDCQYFVKPQQPGVEISGNSLYIYSVGSHDMRSFFKAVKAKEGAHYVDQRKTEQKDRPTDSERNCRSNPCFSRKNRRTQKTQFTTSTGRKFPVCFQQIK